MRLLLPQPHRLGHLLGVRRGRLPRRRVREPGLVLLAPRVLRLPALR